VFLNNRYMDPQLGVFLSVDPLVAQTGEPYLYASGNPVTLSDPSGLCAGREGFWTSCGIDHDGRGQRRGEIHYVQAGIRGTNQAGAIKMTNEYVLANNPELREGPTQVRVETPQGLRIIDLTYATQGFNGAVAVEAKSGASKASGRAGTVIQAEKDAYLLQSGAVLKGFNNRVVTDVQWHFWPGMGGRMAGPAAILGASMSGGDVYVHQPRPEDRMQERQPVNEFGVIEIEAAGEVDYFVGVGAPGVMLGGSGISTASAGTIAGPVNGPALGSSVVPNNASSISAQYLRWAQAIVIGVPSSACGSMCGADM
jgi:hypothetical protein